MNVGQYKIHSTNPEMFTEVHAFWQENKNLKKSPNVIFCKSKKCTDIFVEFLWPSQVMNFII